MWSRRSRIRSAAPGDAGAVQRRLGLPLFERRSGRVDRRDVALASVGDGAHDFAGARVGDVEPPPTSPPRPLATNQEPFLDPGRHCSHHASPCRMRPPRLGHSLSSATCPSHSGRRHGHGRGARGYPSRPRAAPRAVVGACLQAWIVTRRDALHVMRDAVVYRRRPAVLDRSGRRPTCSRSTGTSIGVIGIPSLGRFASRR
jgi:hypothetical protein